MVAFSSVNKYSITKHRFLSLSTMVEGAKFLSCFRWCMYSSRLEVFNITSEYLASRFCMAIRKHNSCYAKIVFSYVKIFFLIIIILCS